MIVGLNLRVGREGRQFHIQVEDLGEARACFEVRLHEGGGILWRKQVSYQDILSQGLPRNEQAGNDPAIKSKLASLGNEPMEMTPAQLAKFLRSEIEVGATVLKAAGIKPQ